MRSKLPKTCLKTLYFAIINSQIIYGLEIYGSTYDTYLEPLIKINNKILRILQNKPLLTPVNQLYSSYNTLSIKSLYKFKLICFVHKYVHYRSDLPEIYQNYFTFNSEVHKHDTRDKDSLHVLLARTSGGQRSIKIEGSKLWNSVPMSLRSVRNQKEFKRKIKLMLSVKL